MGRRKGQHNHALSYHEVHLVRNAGAWARRQLRQRLVDRDPFCWFCGKEVVFLAPQNQRAIQSTIEHLTPMVGGGTDDEANLILACFPCNSRKHDRTLEEFRLWLSQRQGIPPGAGLFMFFGEYWEINHG